MNGADGVVVAHGTDTMHYTSAAFNFILDTSASIITGAQRSSDRPSSDAFINIISSVMAAKSDIAEVTVCMHAEEDDSYCYLTSGVRRFGRCIQPVETPSEPSIHCPLLR